MVGLLPLWQHEQSRIVRRPLHRLRPHQRQQVYPCGHAAMKSGLASLDSSQLPRLSPRFSTHMHSRQYLCVLEACALRDCILRPDTATFPLFYLLSLGFLFL
ncbi:hypothetical protein BDW67DRAFT_152195 [Aspergillus spinulosporus]